MKKLLVIFLALYSFSLFSQEGTKQLMPNDGDRLYLEMFVSGKDFATYGADEKDRLHIYLKEGETMHFGMQMYTDDNYGGNCTTDPSNIYFRIIAPNGNIVYGERQIVTSGQSGFINNYSEAITGPNGVILNETEITDGYNPETLIATQTGNYYIEFDSRGGWWNQRFALKYFDVTVTDNDTVITNPGEPNKSAGRLWSKNWSLTNTSFTEYPAKVYFYVFTSDEFVNKIQYKMKPFSFNFLSNPFGIENDASLNVIEKAQSQDGSHIGSEDIAEYKIYLNDPDRSVWETTALPPPKVKVWHEEELIYDYDYMREPMEKGIELDTLIFEKNNPGSGCSYSNSSLTLFEIETNVAGFTTILLDIDGGGYSTAGNDRVLHRELKKGRNYILWDFRNDNGEIVSNGEVSISATFFGRGATNFPLYDVETLSEVNTKTKRPFNKLCPTLYWDDSQISDWGDDGGTGSMDETDTTQLIYGNTDIPRVWAFNGDQNDQHNGNINTMNAWYNAIDLGRADINAEVITSDTLCINGDRPIIADIHVDTTKNSTLYFNQSDFTDKFSDASGDNLESVEVVSLPPSEKGTLSLNGSSVTAGQIIDRADLNNLNFDPATDETGNALFLWNATDGTYYAEEPDTVNMFINTPPDISHIEDTSICTDENLEVNFTVSDQDDGHNPEDIDVIAYSNNLNVVPNSGIEVTGTGENRTLTVEPFGIQSGYTIIYLQAYDGVTSIIEQFAIKMTPSLEFTGDTSVCAGSQLELTAVEVGADSYTWEREGMVVGTNRTYTDTELYENETGTYTLTVEKDGCISSRDFSVSIYPIVSFTGDTDLCVGENLSLSADETTADEYRWEESGYEVGSSKVLNIENVDTDESSSDYTLYVRKEGCENTSDPFTVSVIENTNTNLSIIGDTINTGENATITIESSIDGIVYNAYSGDSLVNTAIGTGSDMDVLIPANALTLGNNEIEVTADNGNCIVEMNDIATVHLNAQPVAVEDNISIDEDTDTTIHVLANDKGLEDGGIGIAILTDSENGTVAGIGDSTITYSPDLDYFGNDSLFYEVCDEDGDCDSAWVYLNITPVDDVPTANNDIVSVDEDQSITIDVLDNDTGLDAGLVVSVTSVAGNGNTNVNGDNTVTYTPDPDYNGSDSFTYNVEDEDGDSDEATVEITVNPVDDQPVANDDVANTDEDNSVEIFVLENDEGLGDGVADVNIINSPANGTTTVDTYSEDFPVTYTPDPDYNGNDWFEYEVTDEDGDRDEARVDVTINPLDDPVAANDDYVSLDEDTNIDINVLNNDEVPDGIQRLDINNSPEHGTVNILSNNEINYQPDPDYYGEDSFIYAVTDDYGNDSDVATVHITVDSLPDNVVAINDDVTLNEDTNTDIAVLGNDDVPDGVKEINVTTQPLNGTVTIQPNNEISYEPDPEYNGDDNFVYEITDNFDNTDDATVTITVEPVDDGVTAIDDDVTIDEDTDINLSVTDNDDIPDGVESLSIISRPDNGYAEVNDDNTIYYEPDPDYYGEDSFVYEVVDAQGADADQATVNITIEGVNDVPVANDDNTATGAEEAVTVNVLKNDAGLGDGIYSLSIYSGPQSGSASTDLGDSTITYVPDPNTIGDTLKYEIQDSLDQNGENFGEIARAELIIFVGDTNYIPVANTDNVTIDEDNDININVLANDENLYDGVDYVEIIEAPNNGIANVNNDNTVDYSSKENYNGADSFDYAIFDNDGDSDTATVQIDINPVDDIPDAFDDYITMDEDTDTTFNVLENDNGLGDGLDKLEITVLPGTGSAEVVGDSIVNYEPETDFYGTDEFDYTVTDVDGSTSTATVHITVENVNDFPDAVGDSVTMDEDTDTTFNVLENDNGLGDGVATLEIVTIPESGNAGVVGDSIVNYEPATDFYGEDEFEYTVTDVDGESSTATVHITVENVNDTPDAVDDYVTMDEDTDTTFNVLENDNGLGDGVDSLNIETAPQHGIVGVLDDSTINYEPETDFYGTDEFDYTVTDVDGDFSTAIVHITVENVNDRPDAVDDTVTMDEDTDTTFNILENDIGLGDGVNSLKIETVPQNGSVEIIGDSTINYEPETDFYGADEFDYTVTDVDGDSSTATVHITVENVNDTPDAVDDSVTMDEDTDTTFNVLKNDIGLGDGVENLKIEITPQHGKVEVLGDSTINYEPETDFYGTDEFDYIVTDVDGDSGTATVYITVENVNDTPDAVKDTIKTEEDVSVTFNLLENDNGLGDGGLSIDIIESPKSGNVEFTGETDDSTITYTPQVDYYGEDSLVYEVSDVDNEKSTAKVYITVQPVNDYQPVANDDERGTEMNTSVNVDVLFNDTGLEDGDIYLQIDDANEPLNGNVVVTDSNTLDYTPETDYLGDDEFVYQVYDYDNDVSSARVTIHVVADNNVPNANDDYVSTHRNTKRFIDVLDNDTNLSDGGIEVVEWLSPEHGVIESIDSNYVKYVPNNNYVGNDRFVYKINDAEGDYDTASVYVTITDDDNILPAANPDSVTTLEDTEITYDVLSNDEGLEDGLYTLTISAAPKNGNVTDLEINGGQGNITYNPNSDYYGLDSLVYQICDLNNDCDDAKMIIDIQAVDDYQPVAFDDSSGTSINTPVGVNVLMNDTGLGDGGIELSRYNEPNNGDVTDVINNEIVEYTPEADYLGYDYFDYQISDYDGDTDTANVKINVRENNIVPVANPDTATTSKETPIEIDVLDNDIAGDESMADMKVTQFIEPENGSITISEDSLITYTPDNNFNVGIDTFWYKVDDIDGDWDTARVSVIVYDGYNHKPAAFDDYRTLDEDAPPVFIDVLENDTALQDKPIKLSIQSEPLYGTVTELSGDSAIYYEPSPDYFGVDSLIYKIRDINGDWDIANVHLQINPVDDGIPYANDDSTGTSVNTPVDINILMNDENLEDSIKMSIISNPENGSVVINEDSTVTYTPDTDYLGRDVFEYRITDYDGQSDEAKVIIEVRKDNIEPVAIPDSAWTIMNQNVSIHVLRNDSLLDDGVGKVVLFDKPSHGNVIVKPDNTVEYDPDLDYAGTDQFVYKVDDEDGDWDTASVHVTIDSIPNYIPEANDDYQATEINKPVEVKVLSNDSGLEDTPINVWIIDQPANGDAEVPNGSNNVYYEPDTDYLGKDTLQYAVIDNDDDSDTAKVIIHVKEENLMPVAINDTAHTLMNHEVEIHVLNNDSLLEDGVDGIEIYSEAMHGELEITQYNTIIYDPYKWYTGTDEFKYLLKDSDGDSDVATVFVKVEEIPNYVPYAKADSTGTSLNKDVTIDVLRNDKGLNDTPISLSSISEPDNGEIIVNEDKTITYSPDKDYLGYDYFEYQVCDYDDECDAAEVQVHVRENNTVPVAMDDKVYTRMNEPVTVEVLENDSGLDDGMGHITIPGNPSYGKAEVNSNHTITYTPNYWFEGPDTLTYELSDMDGDYDTAQVAIGVLDTDTLPEITITDISGNTSENKTKVSLYMKLQTRPDTDVLIALYSSDNTEGVIDKDTLVFTHQNYDREQEITVTGVNDQIVDGDIAYKIITDNAISDDIIYNNLTVKNVDVINEDNDESEVEVSLLSEDNRTSEYGDRVRLGLILTSRPTSDVLIDMFSTDDTEGMVENNQVVFASSDSIKEKEIVITGVNDTERDGDIDYEIEFNTSSEDTSYNDVAIENFQLVNEDNDEIESFIPDAFSPNNDNFNDRFVIKGLEQYDNLSIKIYNRWGSLVYSNNDYKNNWNGKANASTLGKKELPSSTYYYYLKIKDTGETLEGSIYLKR